MNSNHKHGENPVRMQSVYNRVWAYLHAYARRYRKAFYSIYTI